MTEEKPTIIQRVFILLRDVITGQILMNDAVRTHWGGIILGILLSIVYIANSYQCDKLRNSLSKKNAQARDLRIESVNTETELMQVSRESNIINLLQERNIPLTATNQPPVRL